MKRWLVLLCGIGLTGCISFTTTTPPPRYVRVTQTSYESSDTPFPAALAPPTPVASTAISACTPYEPPSHTMPPTLPDFTPDELKYGDRLAERLGDYVNVLRDYIARVAVEDNRAFEAYHIACPPVLVP